MIKAHGTAASGSEQYKTTIDGETADIYQKGTKMNTTYKMTFEIIVEAEEGVSMNNATDAVSFALFQLGSDGERAAVVATTLVTAEEVSA